MIFCLFLFFDCLFIWTVTSRIFFSNAALDLPALRDVAACTCSLFSREAQLTRIVTTYVDTCAF